MDDNNDVISNMVDYINELKKTYKPHLKVPKSSFWWQTYYGNMVSFIKEIKGSKLINKGKKTVLIALKKKEFGEYIEKLNKLDFVTLLNKIKILQVEFKEFYFLAKIYTDINKNVGLMNNINCEEEGEIINTEDDGKKKI